MPFTRRRPLNCAILCVLLIASVPALGQTKTRDANQPPVDWSLLPDTPAAGAFRAFAEQASREDAKAWRNFVGRAMAPELVKQFTDEQWEEMRLQMKDLWSRIGKNYFGSNTDTRFGLVGHFAGDPLEIWYEYMVEVSADEPHLITDFDVLRATPPAAILSESLSESEMVAELERFVGELIDQELFSGVVLVANAEKIIFQSVAGMASLRYQVPNTMDTRFCLGSMTKMFTACAIMNLIDQGKLSLDDPIGDYLNEDWVSPEAGATIRIKHLLTHTGGTSDFFMNDDYFDRTRGFFREVDTFTEFINIVEPDFEPGSKHEYSNSGFVLLGAIIESVTGRDYHEYMREAFYAANDMNDSDCFDWDMPVPNIATGYYQEEDGSIRSNVYSQRAKGCPAGSSYATAGDLLTFARRFQAGAVVPSSVQEQMITPRKELNAAYYGYGVRIWDSPYSYGHSGGGPGVGALLAMYPTSGHTIVVLANHHSRTRSAIVSKLDEMLARLKP